MAPSEREAAARELYDVVRQLHQLARHVEGSLPIIDGKRPLSMTAAGSRLRSLANQLQEIQNRVAP
jgi:hypothetical protein